MPKLTQVTFAGADSSQNMSLFVSSNAQRYTASEYSTYFLQTEIKAKQEGLFGTRYSAPVKWESD